MDASLHDASLHDLLVDAVSSAVGFALRARHILRARYEGKVSEADTCRRRTRLAAVTCWQHVQAQRS